MIGAVIPSIVVSVVFAQPCRAQFTDVFNVPPDEVPPFSSPGTQINLFDGGTIGDNYSLLGGELNVFSGEVGDSLAADSGSRANISGGRIGDHFHANEGSHVRLVGSDFRLNGAPIEGLAAVGDRMIIEPALFHADRGSTRANANFGELGQAPN